MRLLFAATALVLSMQANPALARPFTPEDQVKEITVSEPDISPDGSQIVYTTYGFDLDADAETSHIWLASWDGGNPRQLTSRKGESETTPRFSPDGKQVGFLSSRTDKDDLTQLWLMPMDGGEAKAVTGIEGSVADFAFSPDGKYLALVVEDKTPELKQTADGEDIPAPIVIDRYHFKQDGIGYLGKERHRLYLYDLAKGAATRMTDGDFDEYYPSWSPDSTRVAFVSTRVPEPDRTPDSNIFIARVDGTGAAPFQLTKYAGADVPDDSASYPQWSPDGKQIAYVRAGDPKLIWYASMELAVVPATGGEEKVLTKTLDRNVYAPEWMPDGKSIRFVVEDDGQMKLESVSPAGGTISTLLAGQFVVHRPTIARNGRTALISSSPTRPYELFAFDGGKLRQLSDHNGEWLKGIDFATPTYTSFKSKDGTLVHGFIMLPPGAKEGEKLPAILHPHGGPAMQYDYLFDSWQQAFAGAGYVVITPNPRGSTGYGTDYARQIAAAWGSVDVQDDLAAVDDAVAKGIADPDRLVVGGWSYGGMSTNYLIASDQRFKAAMAGASIADIFAGYGTDQYVLEYDLELGVPWENLDVWIRNSYPFLQNQKIVTPTLFMVGGADVNVPTLASEQMYQALKTRGIDTELVIYPDQYHSFSRPSYIVDRMHRWLAWYAKYIKQ